MSYNVYFKDGTFFVSLKINFKSSKLSYIEAIRDYAITGTKKLEYAI